MIARRSKKKEETQLHFVGIGGIGMSGIAEVFLNQGYPVSGSDLSGSELTARLERMGARIAIGHRAENISGAQVVVISSAVRPENPEVQEARRLRIPIIPRAEMLGELMRGKTGVAVAGTHGKTTTTSMVATVLTEAGLDPTLVIGGKVDSLGGNAKLGQGPLVVAEADESDGSFLHLPATYGIVTNIDNDHLDYYGDMERVEEAFVHFVNKLPFYGLAAVCAEDPRVRACLTRFAKPFVTYGFSRECDFFAEEPRVVGMGSAFVVHGRTAPGSPHARLGEVRLHVPGRHNVLNALAAIVIATALDLPFEAIARGLGAFRGVKRRFEVRWEDPARRCAVIDDYGHHPTEILATLSAARAFWPGRIITVFQPHRYSRTLHCREGFLSAFGGTDVLLITDIYAAGEEPIDGVSGPSLASEIARTQGAGREVRFVGDLAGARDAVLERFRDGDLVLCLGAGSITRLPEGLLAGLAPGSERGR
ncbi:MAG: UDP-N-acetylmuramate--L-alanine ligase [Oligoflexia bacterium]|nr:UDP-N-acetylmuramate--L-alanine ligase [Oligoflexia bacterium]